ncbi:uncharacterized protein [Magallana gigas]|uniref:uncharacterized protein isoform X2 n=1 Tax=Magallana gigas TaxID=29159 RepID=UPI003341CB03
MKSLFSKMWLWLTLISVNGVSSLVYQHTTFQRHLNPVYDNRTSPFFSSTVSTAQACVIKCHNHPSCESLVYDKVSFQCSLFEGKNVGEKITSSQVYNQVSTKTVHQNIIAHANHLCNGDSPGYFYNESVPVCYKIDTQPRLMDDAVMFCGESGGHLLRIDTEIKQKFVESLNLETTSSIFKYRIDGKKNNTVWTFSNNQPIKRFYWYPGEPANNISSIGLRVGYGGKWDDVQPSVLHGCICEKDIKFN